jgi:hypothetical protein
VFTSTVGTKEAVGAGEIVVVDIGSCVAGGERTRRRSVLLVIMALELLPRSMGSMLGRHLRNRRNGSRRRGLRSGSSCTRTPRRRICLARHRRKRREG